MAFPSDALCAAFDDFEHFLLARGIPPFYLNPGNFAAIGANGAPRPVCVDAKSMLVGKEIPPLSRWFPALGKRKLRRRSARLRARIRATLAE